MTTIGKVAAAVGSITGVSGIAATSAVLAGGGEASNVSPTERIENQSTDNTEHQPEKKKKVFTKPNWQPSSIPELANAKDIQNKYSELPCIKDYFNNISNWNGESTLPSGFKNEDRFPNNENTKSCLVVEYYKQTYESAWWWGEFRLIWTIKNENTKQGFLTVIDAKTKSGGFLGSSAAFFMKKEDGKDTWKVSYAQEKAEHKVNGLNDLGVLIPQTGYAIKKDNTSWIRWGFEPTDTWICNDGVCLEEKGAATHTNIVWEFTGGGSGGGLDEWCENLGPWLHNNFGWGEALGQPAKVRGTWTKKNN